MENQEFLKKMLVELKKPIPAQWRVQSYHKTKPQATVMAYIDARDAMDLLDDHATFGWHREHYQVENKVYCRVGIVMPDNSIQWRSDCGTESNQDAEKGQASDSFKRACVNWGIGRFLYDLKVEYLKTDIVKAQGNYPNCIDENGNKIKDIDKYINGGKKASPAKAEDKKEPDKTPEYTAIPVISAKAFDQLLGRIKGGEIDALEKAKAAFKLSEDQLIVLEDAKKEYNGTK